MELLGSAAALPLLAVGLVLGGKIHVSISQKSFVRLVSLILLGSGSALLLKVMNSCLPKLSKMN